jgi:hypothetical protein
MTRSGAPCRFVHEPHVAAIVVVPLDRMVGMVSNDQLVVYPPRSGGFSPFASICLASASKSETRSDAYSYAYLRSAFSSNTSNSFVISSVFAWSLAFLLRLRDGPQSPPRCCPWSRQILEAGSDLPNHA